MSKPLSISKPELNNATKLSPLQLNEIKVEDKHTVLTPQVLEKMASGEISE